MTKWMRENRFDGPVWQRNYYEHIIRNEDELRRISNYIRTNPLRWALDRENPTGTTAMTEHDYYRHVWEDKECPD